MVGGRSASRKRSTKKPASNASGFGVRHNLISLRSLLSLASVAVADETDGTGDEQGDAGGFGDGESFCEN